MKFRDICCGSVLLSTSFNDLGDGGECALAKFADWEVSNDRVICLTGLQNKWDPAKDRVLGVAVSTRYIWGVTGGL